MATPRILVSWIGKADLEADGQEDLGPILRLLRHEQGSGLEQIYFFNDMPESAPVGRGRSPDDFLEWLADRTSYPLEKFVLKSASPSLRNDLGAIWNFTHDLLQEITDRHSGAHFLFLLSPGYPAAQAAFMVAAEIMLERSARTLLNSSRERGVEAVELPFNLSLAKLINRERERAAPGADPFGQIVGDSHVMQEAKRRARKVAPTEYKVLLRGERGTGKELFARAIHAASRRADKPFVPLDCGAISETLFEAELFGARAGAYTDARTDRPGKIKEADGGTLFLDEIGNMPIAQQSKLLRFLESGTYAPVGGSVTTANVRVIAATNQNLEKMSKEGQFRGDLYDRLTDYVIVIPPLSQRHEDFAMLCRHLFKQEMDQLRKQQQDFLVRKSLLDEAIDQLQQYPWPGNVRELRKRIIQLILESEGDKITRQDVIELLGRPRALQGVPLSRMTPRAFFNHLAAVIEELLDRYMAAGPPPRDCPPGVQALVEEVRQRYADGALPLNRSGDEYELDDDVLGPLKLGRALYPSGVECTGREASYRMRPRDLTLTRSPWDKYLDRYKAFVGEGLIDEEAIRTIRGAKKSENE